MGVKLPQEKSREKGGVDAGGERKEKVLLYRVSCPRGCFSWCVMITCLNPDVNSSEMCESFAHVREAGFRPMCFITLIFEGQFCITLPVLNKYSIN